MGIWSPNTSGSPVHPEVAAAAGSGSASHPGTWSKNQGTNPFTGQPYIPYTALAALHPTHHSNPVGSFFHHLAGDVRDTITGLPATAEIVAKNIAAYNPATMTYRLSHLPGSGAVAHFQGRVAHEDVQAAKALAHDYATRYGPMVASFAHGHPLAGVENLGRAAYEHPGLVAGDIATLWAGAGAAARAGSLAADVANLGEAGSALRSAHLRSVVKGPRVRPSETLTHDLGGGVTHTVTVTKPAMSPNPLTRAVFQRPAAAAARVIRAKLAAVEHGPLKALGTVGRIDRRMGRLGQNESAVTAGITAAKNIQDSRDFLRAVNGLRSYFGKDLASHPHEKFAASLHIQGLLDQPGMTGVEAAQHIVDTWRANTARVKAGAAGPVPRTAMREANANALQAIIDNHPNLLDIKTAPARVQHAVETGLQLGLRTNEAAREAYGLTPKEIQARAEIPQRIVHGGQQIVPDVSKEQARFDAAQADLSRLTAKQPTGAAWSDVRAARSARSAAVKDLTRAQRAGDPGAVEAAKQAAADAAKQVRVVETAHAKARFGNPGTPHQVRAATRELDQARKALNAAKQNPRAHVYTEPTVPGYTPNAPAVYVPHVPVDRLPFRQRFRSEGKGGRTTPIKLHKSLGRLIATGDINMDPRLLVQANHQARYAIENRSSLDRLLSAAAYRTEDGRIWAGPEAVARAAADPERIALVDVNTLKRALRQGDGGEMPTVGFSGKQEVASARGLPAARQRQLVAVNKAALDSWRQTLTPTAGNPVARGYDKALGLWKGATLTLSPRWYLHNLESNIVQYGLASPRDLHAITRANGPVVRDAINRAAPKMMGNFIRENMAAGMTPLAARQAAAARWEKFTSGAFALNDTLEGAFRRGTVLAAAAKTIRGEKNIPNLRLRPERLGGMTDQQIADAIDHMPDAVKAEVIRHAELFMGDYTTFNRTERAFVKRALPFYSWLRVITKLTANLPVRHPLTAQALAVTSEMASPVENPGDKLLPYYARGGINLPGGVNIGTHGSNPFGTVGDPLDALASGGSFGDLANAVASGSESPIIQMAMEKLTGRNAFTGRDFSAPPGYNGTVASFGGSPLRIDPSTGQVVSATHPTPPWLQEVLGVLPFEPVLRGGLSAAAGARPYDTTSDPALLRYVFGLGGNPVDLLKPPSTRPRGVATNPLLSSLASVLAGAPIRQVDPQAALQEALLRNADHRKAMIATLRARVKAAQQLGMGTP